LEATSLPAARVRGARRALLVIIAVAALIIPTDNTPHPERVTATVDKCDLSLHGAAQFSFSLTNGDRTWRGYEVRAFGAGRQSELGASTTLITHVEAGDTVRSRMLVQANGDTSGATCSVLATVWVGDSGHHG